MNYRRTAIFAMAIVSGVVGALLVTTIADDGSIQPETISFNGRSYDCFTTDQGGIWCTPSPTDN